MDLDALLADLADAILEDTPQLAVRDLLQRAVERPGALADALPCTRAELVPLFSSPEITVMKTVWAPGMIVPPHDHRMWAAIGVFAGKEENTFWRRADQGIEQAGGKELAPGEVGLLGSDAIHSVFSPLARTWTGAIHVYGGDFMHEPRSMWVDGAERPNDAATTATFFEEANRTLTKW